MAKGGSIFLDEVGTIALSQQAKLLRVLESGQYERVGDSKTLHTQCRLICASNAPFEKMLNEGTFRTDLYYRLNTIELTVPSLKERIDYIVPLADYFIGKHSEKYQLGNDSDRQTLAPCAQQALQQHDWPGNVRELSHVMERAVLMCDQQITAADLQLNSSSPSPMAMMTLEDAEKKLLKMALQQTAGNVDNAADLLGISSSGIYRRLDKYQIKNK
jgi:transcriptional regulator with PAS, ATPase and Fis domain